VAVGSVECVFEDVSEVDLLEVMGEATRDESTAIAQRLLAVGVLYARYAVAWAERNLWCTDPTDAVAAEVSAVQNISHARAVGQIHYGRTLCERLPAVAKVFTRGEIDFRMVLMIIARTDNVADELIGALDEALAARVVKWMKSPASGRCPHSKPKLRDRLDMWVAKFDPAGVRIPAEHDRGRYVDIDPGASPGMAFVCGHIHATDAAALDQRLDALAASVCEHDPRSHTQRRADACGALGRGQASLDCQCGSTECPTTTQRSAATSAVIHVLAEAPTLQGASDKPGYLRGFGILPAESVRALAASATLKPLTVPTAESAPDAGYRPSATTMQFLGWRDLTCRWPGCDAPVQRCDIDHTVPWPAGPTHPSNTKPYCRTHHLVEDVLRLERSTTPRWHHHRDLTQRADLHHRTPRRGHARCAGPTQRRAGPIGGHQRARHRPLGDDAAAQANPRSRPP
jgi:Domain of unknown function (DUF222)